MKLVGRHEEIRDIKARLADDKAHLLAVVGRRRVGKTFLIREAFKEHKVFEMTGLKDAELPKQLINFTIQMNQYFPWEDELQTPEDWLRAFNQLSFVIENKKWKKKPVVFFDELPWVAGKKSGFVEALGHWWNNWASQQKIIVVVCGSAASWMIEHIVNAKGGLHNRLSKTYHLMPFTLLEAKEFLNEKKITLSHYQLVQVYMAMGGIPHYLDQIEKGKSAMQNIQELYFTKDGVLRNEFKNLYPALFDHAGNHEKIVRELAKKSKGLDRQEILKQTKLTDGGYFSEMLKELELSGFIATYEPLEKKKRDTLYRLTDEYSLFFLRFVDGKKNSTKDAWNRISQSQEYKIWCGYSFENLCMKHITKIKEALGISGVETHVNSFLHKKNALFEKGFQIDLLIDRRDDIITMCEMKFYADEYAISAADAEILRTKKVGLQSVTKTKKMVQIAFVSTYGVLNNEYKMDLVDHDFNLEIFFKA